MEAVRIPFSGLTPVNKLNIGLIRRDHNFQFTGTDLGMQPGDVAKSISNGQVKPAVVMAVTGLSAAEARQKLAGHGGRLRATLDEVDCQASSQ